MNAQTPLLVVDAPEGARDLTTSILQNAAVLRALLTRETFASIKEFAELLGRDDSNLGKSLSVLEEDGALVQTKEDGGRTFRLTDFGRRALQGFDLAEGRLALPAGYVIRTRAQLQPHPLNPRKDWSSEEAVQALDEMRESIILRGIRYPLEIRAGDDGVDYIVSGERRWRALGLAIDEGDIDDTYPIVCQLKDVDDEQHLVLALEENIQRRNLSHLEEARAYAYFRDVRKWPTDKIADTFGGISRKVVQNKLRLLEPSNAALAAQVESGELTYHQALKALIQSKAPQGDGLFGGDLHKQSRGDEDKPLELTAKEALIVIELADRCEKQPHSLFDGYTLIDHFPMKGDAERLREKGIVASRSGGEQAFAKVMLYSAKVKGWLTDNGFYEDRGELLHKARAAIVGEEKARLAEAEGRYVTDWLNVEAVPQPVAQTLASPPPPSEPDLDPLQVCALVEIVAKANKAEHSRTIPGFSHPAALTAAAPMTDPLLKSLCWGGYCQSHYVVPGYVPGISYTDAATELLDRLGLNPIKDPGAVRAARKALGREDFQLDILEATGRYITAPLNVVEPEPEKAQTTYDLPGEDDPSIERFIVDELVAREHGVGLPTGLLQSPDAVTTEADHDHEDDERFAPPTGQASSAPHVVPPYSQNLQAGTDFSRVVADRLARDLAKGGAHWGTRQPEEAAEVVLGLMEDGDFPGAAAAMAILLQRAGHTGSGQQLMRALARHVDRANQEA